MSISVDIGVAYQRALVRAILRGYHDEGRPAPNERDAQGAVSRALWPDRHLARVPARLNGPLGWDYARDPPGEHGALAWRLATTLATVTRQRPAECIEIATAAVMEATHMYGGETVDLRATLPASLTAGLRAGSH